MKKQDQWVFFNDIDWNDPKFNRFNIDTRDFHVGYTLDEKEHEDYDTLIKYDHFFHTKEELKELISRLFEESGGLNDWRLLELKSKDPRVLNWNLKYLRIFRTDKGFIVCNSDNKALSKDLLSCEVNKEYLNAH